jgi:hypothetical protein
MLTRWNLGVELWRGKKVRLGPWSTTTTTRRAHAVYSVFPQSSQHFSHGTRSAIDKLPTCLVGPSSLPPTCLASLGLQQSQSHRAGSKQAAGSHCSSMKPANSRRDDGRSSIPCFPSRDDANGNGTLAASPIGLSPACTALSSRLAEAGRVRSMPLTTPYSVAQRPGTSRPPLSVTNSCSWGALGNTPRIPIRRQPTLVFDDEAGMDC